MGNFNPRLWVLFLTLTGVMHCRLICQSVRGAEEAREFVKGAILNKNVRLRVVARDQYGRLVGEVRYGLLGRKELSTELVRRGLAVVYRGKDASYGGRDRAGWERLEATARKTRQGMWKDGGDGVSPSEYKRQQKARRG